MYIYGFMVFVFLLDSFTKIHYISVGEWISESEVDLISECSIALVEAVTESNTETIMKILYS
jgi:hypothetical protein